MKTICRAGARVVFAGTITVILSACASMYRGSTESITITTPNCPGAVCTLQNKKGVWKVTTPGVLNIPRSDDTILVSCNKGDQSTTYQILSTMAGGSVIAETVLWGPFALINAATDGHREYPDDVQIPMVCN